MIDSTRITAFSASTTGAAGSTVRMIRAQPNWLVRVLALVFVIVVVLPLAVLMIVVVLVAAVIIAGLIGIRTLVNRLRRLLLPRDDGRSNVRVMRRDDVSAS